MSLMKRPLLESERILKSPTLSSFSPSEELADLARLANTLWSTVRWVFRVALGPEVQNDCIAFESIIPETPVKTLDGYISGGDDE